MTADVAIIGGGLAGLSLARQLLLTTDKRVVLLERRAQLPPVKQKVGEATVQVSAYYRSTVLDLEEHLQREHFMKYNLRFYWKTPGRGNDRFEDYSQSYIRPLSNIATYQLDRNKIEGELLRLNLADPRFTLVSPVADVEAELNDAGAHALTFTRAGSGETIRATWVVDASGRARVLARHLGLQLRSPIRHGASFVWVDGLLNIEKLTDAPAAERLRSPARRHIGHLPFWLATNHFMGEGLWFWVIPLHGRTSLGLVYDNTRFPNGEVATASRMVEWVCREFPLFARDLPGRRIVDQSSFRDFAHDCARTISPSRWALTGESGRFADPLYSPGGDLIAIHNTLIADAIAAEPAALPEVCARHERLMRAMYDAYVPAYSISYQVLGDQEAMSLKYTWELAVYFGLYVFPFINGLLTDPQFTSRFLALFGRLGRLNARVQTLLRQHYEWKKMQPAVAREPVFTELMANPHLRAAESTFYEMGVSADAALRIVHEQVEQLQQVAEEIARHVEGRTCAVAPPVEAIVAEGAR